MTNFTLSMCNHPSHKSDWGEKSCWNLWWQLLTTITKQMSHYSWMLHQLKWFVSSALGRHQYFIITQTAVINVITARPLVGWAGSKIKTDGLLPLFSPTMYTEYTFILRISQTWNISTHSVINPTDEHNWFDNNKLNFVAFYSHGFSYCQFWFGL